MQASTAEGRAPPMRVESPCGARALRRDGRPAVKGDLIIASLFHRISGGCTVEASEEAEQYLMPFLCQDTVFPHVITASTGLPRRALELIMNVHQELPGTTSMAKLAVKSYMKMLLLLLVKHYKAHLHRRDVLDRKERAIERLRPLFQFLEQNCGERIHVADAARLCAMSAAHFMGFFKAATGESFVGYLNTFRIAKAQELLSTTEESISQISERVDFCTQSYFGKVFRSMVGTTPLAYRQRFTSRRQLKVAPPSTM